MNTWADRVGHLADHFKTGKTMANWEGDTGFDETVQAMVENAMPPCKSPILEKPRQNVLNDQYRSHRV
jgi:hypothetical protein